MTGIRALRGSVITLAIILLPWLVDGQETGDLQAEENDVKISGTLALWAKYNSNLTLIDEASTGLKKKSAFIASPMPMCAWQSPGAPSGGWMRR